MATLNPSNVVNGNTIQASDIEQLYNAFGTGSAGFTPITGVSLTGSITNANVATTASYALTGSVTQVNTQYYDNGVNTIPADFKFVAGKVTMTNGAATSSVFTVLPGKVLGDTVWINASYPQAFNITSSVASAPPTTNLSILKVNVSASGQVLISGAPSDTGTVIFTGIYI